jgi:hypothetical protein
MHHVKLSTRCYLSFSFFLCACRSWRWAAAAAGWLAARRWAWAQAVRRAGGATALWLAAWLMMAATWGQEVRFLFVVLRDVAAFIEDVIILRFYMSICPAGGGDAAENCSVWGGSNSWRAPASMMLPSYAC